jgi:hypothetical protein
MRQKDYNFVITTEVLLTYTKFPLKKNRSNEKKIRVPFRVSLL